MENKLTDNEIDLIMDYIPCTTEMGENTPLWNKLKRMKKEASVLGADEILPQFPKQNEGFGSYLKRMIEPTIVSEDYKWSDDEVIRLIRYLCNEDDVYGYADGDDNIFKKLLNSYYSQYISPLRK